MRSTARRISADIAQHTVARLAWAAFQCFRITEAIAGYGRDCRAILAVRMRRCGSAAPRQHSPTVAHTPIMSQHCPTLPPDRTDRPTHQQSCHFTQNPTSSARRQVKQYAKRKLMSSYKTQLQSEIYQLPHHLHSIRLHNFYKPPGQKLYTP